MDTETLYASTRPRFAELNGQVAIVSGSSRNIGKGIAVRLAREGMNVVINGRDPDAVEQTASELRTLGANVLAVPADVSLDDEIDRLFDETLNAFGTVDLMVNNAAVLHRAHFFKVDKELLDRHLATNIRGPYLCAYRAAEVMRQAGRGNIVHISSVGGLRAHWRGLPYDMTKGAIDAMTRAMALELAAFGIRVNAVAPGAIRTDRSPDPDSARGKEIVGRVPMARYGSVLEIGAAVAFLASDDASYVTGQVLYVDGGLVAQLSPSDRPV
jgi:NAD(P)-dependent dehydrogenase (short-subunit alcohol dehydrogenase family)